MDTVLCTISNVNILRESCYAYICSYITYIVILQYIYVIIIYSLLGKKNKINKNIEEKIDMN